MQLRSRSQVAKIGQLAALDWPGNVGRANHHFCAGFPASKLKELNVLMSLVHDGSGKRKRKLHIYFLFLGTFKLSGLSDTHACPYI
jgi:hypothetical protein